MYSFSFRAIRRAQLDWKKTRPIPASHPRKKPTKGRLRHYAAGYGEMLAERLNRYMNFLYDLYKST